MSNYTATFTGGNIKTGNIGTISKLMGDGEYKTSYGRMCGTCGGFCDFCREECYVAKSYRYKSVIEYHAKNTFYFRQDLDAAFESLNLQLSRKRKPWKAIRLNQSGEIEENKELVKWTETAAEHTESDFYIYTKNYDAVRNLIDSGVYIPDNFTVLISIWKEYGLAVYYEFQDFPWIKFFVYLVPDFEYPFTIETLCHAYDERGKLDHNVTCDKCYKCIKSRFKIIGCYPH